MRHVVVGLDMNQANCGQVEDDKTGNWVKVTCKITIKITFLGPEQVETKVKVLYMGKA